MALGPVSSGLKSLGWSCVQMVPRSALPKMGVNRCLSVCWLAFVQKGLLGG